MKKATLFGKRMTWSAVSGRTRDDDRLAEHIDPSHETLRGGPLSEFGRNRPSIGARRSGLRRACLAVFAFGLSAIFLAVIAGGLFVLRLTNGPIAVDLAPQITAALNDKVAGGYAFAIGSTAVEKSDHGPILTIHQFIVRDGSGRTILTAPRATVSVDPLELLLGRVSPKRLEVRDIVLRVARLEDGTIAIAAGADQPTDLALNTLFGTTMSAPVPTEASETAGAAPVGPPAAAEAPRLPTMLAKAVDALSDQMFDPAGPLHAVDRLGLSNGTLIVEDRLRKTSITYTNFTEDFDRELTGGVYLTVGADGPAGHWSLAARANRLPDGSRVVDLAADHLSPDELTLAAGLRPTAFETDMPLSFSLNVEVDPDGKLRRAGGPVAFGAGYFKLDDPDHEPAMVDRIEGMLKIDPASGLVDLGAGTLVAGPTSFAFDLGVKPLAGGDWQVGGKATGTFGAERPGETPIAFDSIGFGLQIMPADRRLVLDSFTAGGPEVAFKMGVTMQGTDAGFSVTGAMEMGRMPGHAVVRLWPSWVAAPARAWFLANLRGGTLDFGRGKFFLTNTDLAAMRRQHSVPDDHVHIEFGVTDASMSFMAGVPPLRGLDGTGVITGDTFAFTASKAEMDVSPGHRLTASEGSFVVPSTDPKPTPAIISMRVAGAIDTLADLLSRPALKAYADLPIDSTAVSGSIDGHLVINLKLGPHVPQEETKIAVVATAKDFAATKVIGKESLTDATLEFTADRSGLHAKGEGRMFGAPAQVELRKSAGGAPSEASLTVVLDDAARQKAGVALGKALTGPVTARISTSLTPSDKTKAAVELDFARATLDAALPGLKKAAGKPAKATFVVTQEAGRVLVDQLVFDNGATAIRGSVNLDGNGGFAGAALSQMRLSPGDDARVDIARSGDGLKIVVNGANIDARPFLKMATAGDTGSAAEAASKDIDLDLHAKLLTGANAQALSGAELRLVRKGGQIRRVQMAGRLGKGAVSVTTTGAGPNAMVVVSAKDAGATLSFMDLYKRMDGGQLDTTLHFGDGKIDGTAFVHQFTIREDPSIKKLAEEEIPSNSRNAGARIDSSAVSFTKLEAVFTKVGNRVDVKQGSMFGPQVGATVEGSIDFGRDKVQLDGTFVPIYGLNNLFSQIPVVGLLLGGGAHEGLFALNYRITGSASAPVLSFNPLSALAPGFLRKIFGAIDNAAQQSIEDGVHDQSAVAPTVPE